MDWRLKALVQNVFSHLPQGHRLNYLFQKHLTHSVQITKESFLDIVSWGTSHMQAIQRHESRALNELLFYEFGTGYHLIGPFTFYSYGVTRQIVVDIRPLLQSDLANQTIANFERFEADLALPRIPRRPLDPGNPVAALKQLYGIDYRAPCDARSSGISSNSVDWVTSTSTLEHISPSEISSILRECHRILRAGGMMSMSVDYADHYAFVDTSITEYNFLRYSDRMWKLFSPPLHFQNRLRHPEYVRLFEEGGFEIVEERRREGTSKDLETVRELPIDQSFSGYTVDELAARGAYFVLRRRNSGL